jgi:L-ascorbate metabolism protein UlaG (beta-lactamase superfamily)
MTRLSKLAAAVIATLLLLATSYVLVQANRRPSLDPWPSVPPASPGASLTVRYAGVATLLFDDGETAWMTDGFFSRPSLARTALWRIAPDPARIDDGLLRLGAKKLAAVVPVHSHYDHAMDSPLVAMRTGALLVGSESTLNIGRGLGLPAARMKLVRPGDTQAFGRWKLTFIAGRHVPLPVLKEGVVETIDAPLVPPAHSTAWREGQSWALHVEHASGARFLVLGSAGFIPGSLQGVQADTVFLGTGSVGKQARDYRAQWWAESVSAVQAKRVIPIHWDDFGEPLDRPLVAFPYLVDDVGATMKDLEAWAARDRVELRLPLLFTPFVP